MSVMHFVIYLTSAAVHLPHTVKSGALRSKLEFRLHRIVCSLPEHGVDGSESSHSVMRTLLQVRLARPMDEPSPGPRSRATVSPRRPGPARHASSPNPLAACLLLHD